MIHYTCDRCKRTIHPHAEVHYQIKIDVQPVGGQDGSSSGDDADALTELHQMLENLEHQDAPNRDMPRGGSVHYDLCPRCYQQFSQNPLGRELAIAIGFSNN